MRTYLHAFWMCQSMFCALPCPGNYWKEECRDKMLLFLPFVGLEIGILWAILAGICRYFAVSALIQGAVLCCLPFLMSGFIHLDGFMDVTDAVKSCRNLERRREILKDSHVGAFAVIGCVLLMILQFAFCSAIREGYLCLALIPAVSRCCSALAIACLKPMSTSQYNGQKAAGSYKLTLFFILLCCIVAGFALSGKYGLSLPGTLVGYCAALRKGYRSLEGMNGDISGYALTVSELCGVICIAMI